MRILRVAQTLYPDQKGGGAYHVHALSRDQASMGHDVTVLTTGDPDLPHIERQAGYAVVRYPATVDLLGNDMSLGVGQYLADGPGVDVVHAHSHLYFSTNLAALRRRLDETPLAITNHGLYSQTAPEWVFDKYLRTIGRWTFDQADVVFCYTEEDKRRLRRFGVESRIDVVFNGIDTDRFTPDGPESELIDHDGPVVLFVGRLVEGKRPGATLEAVRQVREDYPNAKLYLCGEGPMRDGLEGRSGDGVEFLGHVPYDAMPKVYRSADVLVLPSRAEGLPRTVLEAIASGVGVVTSDLEQVSRLVEKHGYTAPAGDVEAFADRIGRTIEATPEPSARPTDHDISWRTTVERTTDTLQRLVNEG